MDAAPRVRDRHCEPTGRANARPMTGSAKQSIALRNNRHGLLRRFAPRNDKEQRTSTLRAVGGFAGAAIEYAHLLVRHFLVESQCRRLEVALWHVGGLEMAIRIL